MGVHGARRSSDPQLKSYCGMTDQSESLCIARPQAVLIFLRAFRCLPWCLFCLECNGCTAAFDVHLADLPRARLGPGFGLGGQAIQQLLDLLAESVRVPSRSRFGGTKISPLGTARAREYGRGMANWSQALAPARADRSRSPSPPAAAPVSRPGRRSRGPAAGAGRGGRRA